MTIDHERRTMAELIRAAEEATQIIGVLVARQGGELALTDAELDDVSDRAYAVETMRDTAYMRTVIKAVRRG